MVESMKRLLTTAYLACSLILFSSLTGAGACRCSTFEIGADLLYWKPVSQPFQWILEDTASTEFLYTIGQDLDWGYRVWACYRPPCWCQWFLLRWTELSNCDSAFITRPQNATNFIVLQTQSAFPTASSTVSAYGKLRQTYKRLQLRGYHPLCANSCNSFALFAGIDYLRFTLGVKLNDNGDTTGTSFLFRGNNRYRGGVIELGFAYQQYLPCGFSLSMDAGGLLAVGSSVYTYVFGAIDQPSQIKTKNLTSCMPGITFSFSVNGSYIPKSRLCSNACIAGSVGLALDYYFQPVDQHAYVNNPFHIHRVDVGYGGPFFNLTVGY